MEVLEGYGRTRIYEIGIASEWLLFAYAAHGVASVRGAIDGSRWTVRRWLRYALAAFGAAVVWGVFGALLGRWGALRPGPEDVRHLMTFFPRGESDRWLWAALSISAGFCEEFVYRGYLQQQFERLTGRLSIALLAQAVLYSLAHAALPWQIMVVVLFLGLLFGGLAATQRSLVPGMMLHAAMNLAVLLRPR